MDYSRKFCRGLCQQADDIGMCMGICSTSEGHAQSCYDAFKNDRVKRGVPYTPIAFFENKGEEAPTPEHEELLNKPNLR